MSKHWIVILLLISLAFNLAVLGMFLYMKVYHQPPFNPAEMQGHRQWGEMDRLDKYPGRHWPDSLFENKDEIKVLREAFRQSRKDFIETMNTENFNEPAARIAMEKSLKAQEILEKKLGESLIDVRTKMSPEDSKKFFKEWMKRRNHRFRDNDPNPDKNN
jgi:hypothetical protein